MAQPGPGRPHASGRFAALAPRVHALLTRSLILYLAAVLALQAWEVLNMDIVQLVRRLH